MVDNRCVFVPLKGEENKLEASVPPRRCWEMEKSLPESSVPECGAPHNEAEECRPTGLCWERSGPFEGGSVPWRGTSQQQREAARRAAEAAESDPPCRWSRCPWASCPLYSCSGPYDLPRYRPVCRSITRPEDDSACGKKDWCWPFEGNILHHCDPCPPPRYHCPAEEPRAECPQRPRKILPHFRWKDGIPYPNYGAEPYPHLRELLHWKDFAPSEPAPRKETDLWALGCWSFEGDEPSFAPCAAPPPCPGRPAGDTPPFVWHDGYARENHAGLPYPGHGPAPFDPCRARLDALELQRCGPRPRRHAPEEIEATCRAVGGSEGAWCASMATSNATPS